MDKFNAICSEIISYNRPARTSENLKLLYSCIDLTNLNSFALQSDIEELCNKATMQNYSGLQIPTVAAICIFPNYIALAKPLLENSTVKLATVSASFPHAQTFIDVKYLETEMALQHGATEVDIVINLSAFLNENASLVFDEIKTLKQLCGENHLKVILEADLLKDSSLIEQASIMSLEAGADFIKTSTGKDGSVASIEAAYIMCKSIHSHFEKTNVKAGFKAAGGIATTDDALNYMAIVNDVLGDDWLTPQLFRIGASRLAGNLLSDIKELEG